MVDAAQGLIDETARPRPRVADVAMAMNMGADGCERASPARPSPQAVVTKKPCIADPTLKEGTYHPANVISIVVRQQLHVTSVANHQRTQRAVSRVKYGH
jgi:hypothetical protein